MRIFISSVRRGLGSERDALPGLIRAIGHEPSRFEDFGAQPEPSREACLKGVESSDVYVLLIGPYYGHRFPDTNQSPTHDEWIAATTKGMPRLVFRKKGVDLEPDQEEFVSSIGAYGSGVFYQEFADISELQIQVAAAIRQAAEAPSPLSFQPLADVPGFVWRDEWEPNLRRGFAPEAYVELHVVPLAPAPVPARLLREMPTRLLSGLRSFGAIAPEAGAEVLLDDDAARVLVPQTERRDRRFTPGALRGVRLSGKSQFSTWDSLPRDDLGGVLDHEDLARTLAGHLRLCGAMNLMPAGRLAVAVGLGGTLTMLSQGTITDLPRRSASMGFGDRGALRVLPDESVSAAALDRGAEEVARNLTLSLLEGFTRGR